MRNNRILIVLIAVVVTLSFQSTERTYPKDYFRSPVNGPIRLSGSCGELRSNHFHMGIDIKPQKRGVAEPIYAVAEGFVSRIVVSPRGYGNGIYIQHPNGYTSVYGHLKTFNDKINEYVKSIQYQDSTFSVDLEKLSPDLFPVNKGEMIGKMGNAGSSGGPHLHFELRDNQSGHALNPLLFGFKVTDDVHPRINQLKVYALNHKHETTASKVYDIKGDRKTGQYNVSPNIIKVTSGRIGLGIKTFDFMTGVSNWNGPYTIKMYQDDALKFHFEAEEFSFDEWYYLNAHVDYRAFRAKKSYINRCYLLSGNKNSTVYKEAVNRGVLDLKTGEPSNIRFIVEDISGNTSILQFQLLKEGEPPTPKFTSFNYILPFAERSLIRLSNLEAEFPKNSFYEDVYLSYQYSEEKSNDYYSGVHHLHDKYIPIHHSFTLKIKPTRMPAELKDKALIVQCGGGSESGYDSEWDDDFLVCKTRSFGDYCIGIDTIPPKITNISFKENMVGQSQFTFKMTDNLSGIHSYDAYVDGKWTLLEYDMKTDRIYHKFDDKISSGEHDFKLVIVDRRGNEAVFEKRFRR